MILFAGTVMWADLANAQTPQRAVLPDEVKNLVATAKGRWTSYGLNADGQITKRLEYPDELMARELKVENGRASVSYTAKMHFPGQAEPFTMQGKEGYYLNADGTLGDYFTEQFGQTTRYKQLSEGIWTAAMPAYPQELEQFGFSNVISGTHVMVKVISKEKDTETHRIIGKTQRGRSNGFSSPVCRVNTQSSRHRMRSDVRTNGCTESRDCAVVSVPGPLARDR